MANLTQWITDAANGEPIEAVVIGEMGWGEYGSEQVPNYASMPKGVVLTWEDARKWLDYEFDASYGAPGCNAIYAWTPSFVIFISQYDGSTGWHRTPRNPCDIMPEMPGG